MFTWKSVLLQTLAFLHSVPSVFYTIERLSCQQDLMALIFLEATLKTNILEII